MKEENVTRQKLLVSAKEEFMEKGFMKSSLRNICKKAGVTTGALYFFFEDKEALFGALVEEPVQQLMDIMVSHYEGEAADMQGEGMKDDYEEDYFTAKNLIHYMYQHYDEFQLILTKSQGSKYESCVERCVEVTEQHWKRLIGVLEKRMGKRILDDFTIHWFSHMQINIFVNLLTHEPSEEAAQQHMEQIMNYLIAGWEGLLR